MKPRFRFTLNGGPRCEVEGGTAVRPKSQRVWALVGYLALRRGEWVPREVLSGELWLGVDEIRARARLRQTLQYAREAFGDPSPFDVRRDAIRLSPERCGCDVWDDSVASAFLDGLRDAWIQEARPNASHLDAIDSDLETVDSDPTMSVFAGATESELEQLLPGNMLVWMALGKLQAPIELLQEERRKRGALLPVVLALAELRFAEGDAKQAGVWVREALALDCGNERLLAHRHYLDGLLAHNNRQEERADLAYRQALRLSRGHSPILYLNCLRAKGFLHRINTDPQSIAKVVREGVQIARILGDDVRRGYFHYLDAIGALNGGDKGRAKKALANARSALETPGKPGQTAIGLAGVGRAYQGLGDHETADTLFEAALAQVRTTDCHGALAEITTYVADRKLALGEYELALALHLEALVIRRRQGSSWGAATSLRGAGFASLELDLAQQSEAHLRDALVECGKIADDWMSASVLFPLARLYRLKGMESRARRCAALARNLIANADPKVLATYIPAMFVSLGGIEAFETA